MKEFWLGVRIVVRVQPFSEDSHVVRGLRYLNLPPSTKEREHSGFLSFPGCRAERKEKGGVDLKDISSQTSKNIVKRFRKLENRLLLKCSRRHPQLPVIFRLLALLKKFNLF